MADLYFLMIEEALSLAPKDLSLLMVLLETCYADLTLAVSYTAKDFSHVNIIHFMQKCVGQVISIWLILAFPEEK